MKEIELGLDIPVTKKATLFVFTDQHINFWFKATPGKEFSLLSILLLRRKTLTGVKVL